MVWCVYLGARVEPTERTALEDVAIPPAYDGDRHDDHDNHQWHRRQNSQDPEVTGDTFHHSCSWEHTPTHRVIIN